MALPEGTVPVTVYMDRKYVERIDGWAEKLDQSRSKVAALLIESAVETDGWQLDVLSSRPGLWFIEAIRVICKAEKETGDAAGAVPAA